MKKNNSGKVARDYRERILVDRDNPILAVKANRDRFTVAPYSGLPQIGSENSEDALTWNVFRTLEINQLLPLLAPILGELVEPKVLYWTLAASPGTGELQFIVGDTIRQIDGAHDRQMTEPDIVVATSTRLLLVECKLSPPGRRPSHLWEGRGDGPRIRRNDYLVTNANPFLKNPPTELYERTAYQLCRMAFYAYQIGNKLGLRPELVSLANRSWWDEGTEDKLSARTIWERFTREIDQQKLKLHEPVFWQDIREHMQAANHTVLYRLVEYMRAHACL